MSGAASLTHRANAEEMRKWDRAAAMEGDTAAPGKSVASMLVFRKAVAEAASWNKKTVIQVLWDLQAFFDSIPAKQNLVKESETNQKEAEEDKMTPPPAEEIAVALQSHRAVRRLLCAGAVSAPVGQIGRSILAGCTSSTSLARARFSKDR